MILDIVYLAIAIICISLGIKKGLVRSVCNVFSFLISAIVAYVLYRPVTDFVTASSIGVFVNDKITSSFKMPQVDLTSLPVFLRGAFESSLNATGEAVNVLTTDIAGVVIGVISVVITIIVVKLLISLTLKLLDVFAKFPVIKQFNGILGGAFGVVSAYFWISLLAVAISYISVLPVAEGIRPMLEGSSLSPVIAENNLILKVFSGTK